MRYAVRGRCGHRIAIIRRAGKDVYGDRDCVLVVLAYGIRGKSRDQGPGKTKAGASVFHNQSNRLAIQTSNRVCVLGGDITADTDPSLEITRRLQRAWACFQRCKMEIYVRPGVRLRLKVRLLKPEVVETLLYGCITWSPDKPDYDWLRRVHRSMILRCLGWRKRKRDDDTLSYAGALAKTASESIEAIVRKRKILFEGFVARMGEKRLPQRVMFGELVGGKGYTGGQYSNWIVYLNEDMSVLGMKFEGWRKAAQTTGRWCRRVEEGAELLMWNWHETERRETADAQRLRQRHPPSAYLSGRGGGRAGKGGRHAQEIEVWVWQSSS